MPLQTDAVDKTGHTAGGTVWNNGGNTYFQSPRTYFEGDSGMELDPNAFPSTTELTIALWAWKGTPEAKILWSVSNSKAIVIAFPSVPINGNSLSMVRFYTRSSGELKLMYELAENSRSTSMWVHYAYTWTGSEFKVYVNGQLASSLSNLDTSFQPANFFSAGPIEAALAGVVESYEQFCKGKEKLYVYLMGFRVYRRKLSNEELGQLASTSS